MTARWVLDYRAALVNREGIGRAVREWVRALAQRDGGPELALFAWTGRNRWPKDSGWERAPQRVQVLRAPIPHRVSKHLLALPGLGLAGLARGALGVHHFQLNHLPAGRAVETATLFDTLWSDPTAPWIDPGEAKAMAARASALARRCARVQAPSAHAAASIESHLRVPRERIDIVPLGIDHVLRGQRDEGAAPAGPFLFTAARVDGRKNHLAVLRALERLAQRSIDVPWVVAGPRGYGCEPFLEALARSPVRSRVRWVGPLSEADLIAHYQRATAFVFPSLGEGFGLPPLEAMALGCATIASRAGSLGEVLADGALLVDGTDLDGLTEALDHMLTDDASRAAWSERGRRRAEQFSWARGADCLLASWERALFERHQPNPPQAR